MRATRSLISLLAIALCCAPFAVAQITNVTSDQQTPTHGVGHDYIQMLSETVDPSTGALSIRISVPIPKARGFTLPFAFTYDSNNRYPMSLRGGSVGWNSTGDRSQYGTWSQDGWGYSIPFMSYHRDATNDRLNGICDWTSNYAFQDPSGGRHALNMGTAKDRVVNSGACGAYGKANYYPGGDTQYSSIPSAVADHDGTVYDFFGGTKLTGSGGLGGVVPSNIVDRNGNLSTITVTTSGFTYTGFTYTDSLGRAVLTANGFGNSGDTVAVPGLPSPYTLTWGTSSPNYSVGISSTSSSTGGCTTAFPAITGPFSVIRSVSLPNGQQYTFSYDSDDPTIAHPFGLVSKITYPSGGWVKYTWRLNPLSTGSLFRILGRINQDPYGCYISYDTPAIATRTVSFDGSSVALTQSFSYSTSYPTPAGASWTGKATTLTTSGVGGVASPTVLYSYTPFLAPGSPNEDRSFNPQVPVEQSITYKENSTTVKTVTKAWQNQYLLTDETVQLGNGSAAPTSSTHYVYYLAAQGFQLQEKDEYDFGSGSKGSLLRKTLYNYASFPSTPRFPAASIFGRPSSVITYDGGGNRVAETDYNYDQTSVISVGGIAAATRDPRYGSNFNYRGNPTTMTQQCFQGTQSCITGNPTTTLAYDETGQALSKTDPCGNTPCSDMTGTSHTTTYSYADSYTILSGGVNGPYTPTANTNAFLTKVTDPLGHIQKFSYDYSNGQMTISQDQNDINSGRVGTTYIYNDSSARPTKVSYPDGGQTTISYNDSPPSPSVTTSKLITSGQQPMTRVSVSDGVGHVVQSKLCEDGPGCTQAIVTGTTYDGMGRVFTQSNPHRATASSTDGTTSFGYDALGRTTQVVPPDGTYSSNYVSTTYSENVTTVTDQVGNPRRSVTDALGRLIEVDEPAAGASGATPGTGSITIGGSERSATFNACPSNPSGPCWVTVYDSTTINVSVGGFNATPGCGGPTETASSCAGNVAAALNVPSSPVIATAGSSSGISVTAKASGYTTNYSLSASCTPGGDPHFSGCSFSASSSSSLTGGTSVSLTNPMVTTYGYDALDNLLTVTQKGGTTDTTKWRTRSFSYDSLSRLLCSSNPENSSAACPATATPSYTVGTTGYTYDPNNNLKTKVSPAPNQTTSATATLSYCYDALNRLTSKAYTAQSCPMSSPTATYTYDLSSVDGDPLFLNLSAGSSKRSNLASACP